jgi:hypothetical protein
VKHIVDPKQKRLFDPYEPVFSEMAYQRLADGWQGAFRHIILDLMPAHELGAHFHKIMGRPTKELYAVAGLLLIKELKSWTPDEATLAFMCYGDIQYALNLEPAQQSMCTRTFERYEELLRDDDLAAGVMHQVTTRMAKVLELKIEQQRLDSTHVFSDMASFARTRLLGVAIKRFLTQVKRHAAETYAGLPEELRQRYEPSVHQLFGKAGKDATDRTRLRQQVAEDMHLLVERFANDTAMSQRTTYQSLVLIFQQQCVVESGKVTVRAKTGGNCVQNPSDPDATYDGKKGPGYQVQIAETCHPDNEVQLITSALPQTAVESDACALQPVLEDLATKKLLPETMLADTSYGSDANQRLAAEHGVELVSPVSGIKIDADRLNVDDFATDAAGRVVSCPAGRMPLEVVVVCNAETETETTTVTMPNEACAACEFRKECPIEETRTGYRLEYTDKQRRLEERRREEATAAFRERYARRSGIESTNSGLKRRLAMGQLRVRGSPSVFPSILLKIAGWNLLRAAASKKVRELVVQKMAAARQGGRFPRFSAPWPVCATQTVELTQHPPTAAPHPLLFLAA